MANNRYQWYGDIEGGRDRGSELAPGVREEFLPDDGLGHQDFSPVPSEVLDKFRGLVMTSWEPFELELRGIYDCPHSGCGGRRGQAAINEGFDPHYLLNVRRVSILNHSKKSIFFCRLIYFHYLQGHGFHPGPEFIDAVQACPPMDSILYFRHYLDLITTECGIYKYAIRRLGELVAMSFGLPGERHLYHWMKDLGRSGSKLLWMPRVASHYFEVVHKEQHRKLACALPDLDEIERTAVEAWLESMDGTLECLNDWIRRPKAAGLLDQSSNDRGRDVRYE